MGLSEIPLAQRAEGLNRLLNLGKYPETLVYDSYGLDPPISSQSSFQSGSVRIDRKRQYSLKSESGTFTGRRSRVMMTD